MGKGRRSSGPSHTEPTRASATEHSAEVDVGNAAHAEDMDGRYVPMDAAGDGARPVVDNARLALEVRYEGQTPFKRLLQLLESSNLPEDTQSWLADRLRNTQATQTRVDEAVASWFGEGPDARERAEHALAAVAGALESGAATERGWQAGDATVEIAPATSIRESVDNLIGGLAGEDRTAVVGLCRQLHLAVLFDDEDDEVELDWASLT